MDVLEIETQEELEAWFKERPPAIAQVVAARAALRVLPHIVEAKNDENFSSNIILPVSWAVTTSWVASKYPTHDVDAVLSASASAASAVASAAARSDTSDAVFTAARSAARSASAFDAAAASDAVLSAVLSAFTAVTSDAVFTAALTARSAAWKESLQDCAFLEDVIEQGEEVVDAARDLAGQPLWRTQTMPAGTHERWNDLKDFLSNADDNWQVWRDWYQARLDGGKTIDVPNDLLEDLDVRIATLDEELWRQGPAEVNAKIQELMDGTLEVLALSLSDDIPPQKPASIKPVWDGDELTLPTTPIDDDFSAGSIESALKALKNALSVFASDLAKSEQNIDGRVVEYLNNLADKVPEIVPPLEELFEFARNEKTLDTLAETARDEWSALSAAEFDSVVQFFKDTVAKFPEWRAFSKQASETEISEEQARIISVAVGEFVEELAPVVAQRLIAPEIQITLKHLGRLLDERLSEPWLTLNIQLSFVASDTLESFANVMKKVAERLLPHIKAGASKQVDKTAEALGKWLVRSPFIIGGATIGKTPLLTLIETFPKQLGFLKPYLELLPTIF